MAMVFQTWLPNLNSARSDCFWAMGMELQASATVLSTGQYLLGLVTTMAAADLNGDGKLDLAIPNGTSVSVLLGNGDGTFQTPTSVPFKSPVFPGGITSGVYRVAVGDFNGDGVARSSAARRGRSQCVRTGLPSKPGFWQWGRDVYSFDGDDSEYALLREFGRG